jgi:hypothetical protein
MRVFNQVGATVESDLVRSLDDLLDRDRPDVISMSAGCRTCDATGLLSLRLFYETRLRHHKGVVLVTAAGNDGDRRPFWPAAAPVDRLCWSVGHHVPWPGQLQQLRRLGRCVRAGSGSGQRVPGGTYEYHEPPRKGQKADVYGMARWSGTSFATPVVAGLIAARMSHTGENGRDAAPC